MMTKYDELKNFFHDHEDELRGKGTQLKKFRQFREDLKRELSWLEDMKGRKEFKLYIHCLKNDILEPPNCVICGSKISTVNGDRIPKCCSRKCTGKMAAKKGMETSKRNHGGIFHTQCEHIKEKTKKTMVEKYGSHFMESEEGKEKHKAAIRERHGVDNPFQMERVKAKIAETNREKYGGTGFASPFVGEKIRDTMIECYGVINPQQSETIRKRIEKTMMERYGVRFFSQTEEGQEKFKQTMLTRHGVSHPRQIGLPRDSLDLLEDAEWVRSTYEQHGTSYIMELTGLSNDVVLNRLHRYGIALSSRSSKELAILNLIKNNYSGSVVENDRSVLGGREIDILLPDIGIGIEFNGVHWHSTKYVEKNYHLKKTTDAKKNGVRLIHIFEDEWDDRREQVESKLKRLIGVKNRRVYGRHCEHTTPSKDEVNKFHTTNHIQGKTRTSANFGLTDKNGELVAVMSFTKRTETSYELSRYSTSADVIGGFSKVLKVAKSSLRDMGVTELVSFADLRFSFGDLYEKTGWVLDRQLPPNYTYLIGNKRVPKQKFRRKYLPAFLGEKFDPTVSEVRNMTQAGYYQVFDCGLLRYKLII